ncbi:MAG: hypothetical protein A3E87_02070 [Gammaproteobacteria bacterium RIFCSPHIGHO2_12_FULL_35_23]|nr:MAG: hypothetical protein A3E87_02070 [Gammaproteobacteria bacterium RIFCSPHIGHO2_12_FULL_35_23]
MNIRDLQYLITLYETKHFGKAAEKCFVSQPTLSMQIKKIEEELEIQLIERNNKPVLFTPVGEKIVDKARIIIQQVSDIKQVAKAAKDPFCATIQLSLIPTIGPYLLPKILPKINKALPQLRLFLHEEKTDLTLKKLKSGSLDAAILALPIDTTNLAITPLYQEKFLIALPKQHPLNNKSTLTLKDIQQENLLLLSEGHCLREQALEACHLANRSDFFEATSLETLRYMVASGVGITLLPELAAKTNSQLLSLRPFKSPEPYREIVLIRRKSSPLESCLIKLSAIISAELNDR